MKTNNGQPRQGVLHRPLNGPNSKVAWRVGAAMFVLVAGLLGNAVRDGMKAAAAERAALEERLDMVEETLATVNVNRFTDNDGTALELRVHRELEEAIQRLEAKIDEIGGQGK